jgi:hypothetical protein
LKTEEIVAMMRENAALCNLETEVILALKANAVGDQEMLQRQIVNIMVCLQRLDDIRRRNDTRSQSEEEGS